MKETVNANVHDNSLYTISSYSHCCNIRRFYNIFLFYNQKIVNFNWKQCRKNRFSYHVLPYLTLTYCRYCFHFILACATIYIFVPIVATCRYSLVQLWQNFLAKYTIPSKIVDIKRQVTIKKKKKILLFALPQWFEAEENADKVSIRNEEKIKLELHILMYILKFPLKCNKITKGHFTLSYISLKYFVKNAFLI